MKIPAAIARRWKFLAVLAVLAAALAFRERLAWMFYNLDVPTPTKVEQGLIKQDLQEADFTVVAENLHVPWEIAFLPDGRLILTERDGDVRLIDPKNGSSVSQAIEGVVETGESGLLGLALHPRFADNGWVYLYSTYRSGERLKNRVERYRLVGSELKERTTVLQNIPGAQYHDGGRLAFGPDGMLYVTTGDAGEPVAAQDRQSLAGKILRIKDDGGLPADNPFGNAVWSYGHRNPQGLVWDAKGRLWATEHGRSGVQSGLDELNAIEKGRNYGWPTVQGDETEVGMTAPAVHSGPWDTWAPADAAYREGSVYFGGLRGEALYQAAVEEDEIIVKAHFEKEFGRIRVVAFGPDRYLYVATSNTDGRGLLRDGDDKIIRINPRLLP